MGEFRLSKEKSSEPDYSADTNPSPAMIARLYTIASLNKWTREQVHNLIAVNYGKKSTKELTHAEYEKVVGFIQQKAPGSLAMEYDKYTKDLFR